MKRPLTLLALALLPLAAAAQAAKLDMPDFSALAAKAKEKVVITLDADMLKSASGFMGGGNDPKRDAQVAEALRDVEGIYIRVFEFDAPGQYSMRDIEPVLAQTKKPGWKAIMQIEDDEDRVEMWMRQDTPQSPGGGFLLVAMEPDELVIVNIAGKIDLQKLRALQGRMGIPGIPGLGPVPPAPPVAPVPPAPAVAPAPPAPAAPGNL